ncbi:zinc finger protein with KRAB and SCAN domains 7-like isoform X3 [Ctenocephalides felis]|uniref:zinc finger protein with KRAB and SCAN domains 7-like isoform X3 n=1 Tax=Ctenocephalides felis TaxID=7515 RepID=UPI000E6E44E9|nr:zinc finger protein with KRAB and SCAN domains 7-like isoform X3 [Ctenocephalides felis]
MNFTPFTGQFAGTIPTGAVHQFATAKFAQNIASANGQVLGVLSGGEGGVHYLRPVDGTNFATNQVPTSNTQTLITLPITMPGSKPGEPQQTVQIQVVNTNAAQQVQQPKYQVAQMHLPLQTFQQGTTVLTVAYNPQEGGDGVQILGNQGLPEDNYGADFNYNWNTGMTVVAAIQPQDLQLLANSGLSIQNCEPQEEEETEIKDETVIKQEIKEEIVQETLPLSLHHFLKFSAETIKRESLVESSPLCGALPETHILPDNNAQEEAETQEDGSTDKPKRKKKYKKKPPKPRRPKPGQVQIATALDGTTLFCCPECHMAYPEKECLEQHLVGHKIERRFICDICGAGLKRKEHLERHKLGHNPDRPFICSICMKGFKRKEHLNLHFVIHSGEKTEVCEECGKGFYRKDHLRKHARSHVTRKLKEQMMLQSQQSAANQQQPTEGNSNTSEMQQPTQHSITLPNNVTIQVPTSNLPLPVQITVPQLIPSPNPHEENIVSSESTSPNMSTVVLPSAAETGAMSLMHRH